MQDENLSIVERAEKAAKAIEEGNKKFAELVQKQETLAARMTLGGKSDAGQTPPPPKEETPTEYKNRILKGFKE